MWLQKRSNVEVKVRCNIYSLFSSSIMSSSITKKILLYKVQSRQDPEAFAELYDEYVKQIYRFVYFKVSSHEEAEDITSEIFLKAWNYVKEKKEIKSFSGLLYKIARNCIIDLYRSRSTRPENVSIYKEELVIGDNGKLYADLEIKIEAERIIGIIKKLKEEYQEAITLRYVDGLAVEEIAEITGKGNIAVRVTLHRALQKIKQLLEIEANEGENNICIAVKSRNN